MINLDSQRCARRRIALGARCLITLAILAGCTSEPANRQAGSAGDVAAANGPDDTRNASPNAAVGCAASAPIVLRGELHGAVHGELVATSATTHCEGMQRPARNGVRLQFRIAKGEQISNLTMIVGIDKLGRGDVGEGLRTTLTIIRGMADQIESKPDTWAIKGGQMIRQNAQNLLQLVNQILDLQKLEVDSLKLNLVRGEVIQYLNYIFQSFQSYAMGKRVTLHFLSDVEQLTMDYDSEKVLRILSNLLSNAIKFTEEEGNVYLYLAQTDKAEPHLQIRVQDTGIGIPEAQLPYIYDRFYQVETHSASHGGGGTGIGLALTRELVELMDGNIQVSSTVGKGTTFTVDLPIRRSADTPLVEGDVLPADLSLPAASAAPTDLTHTELRIPAPPAEEADRPLLLIVEDNADVVQYLVACLEDQYRYQVARDGQEGIDRAIELVPDLILSDVMMPKKDGYELCKTLKQDGRTSHIPIVLLTAKADLDSRISGLERGADAYLTKPFEQRELMVRLQKLFELRQALQKRYRGPELATPDVSISEKVTRPEDQFMQKLQTVIYDNLGDENFGIAELCRGMASSRTQLHNKIKALTGKSTSIYLRSLRLHRAKALLLTTDLNVTEIAYEVGFRDPKYFSRTFAEEFGKSPSKMRG